MSVSSIPGSSLSISSLDDFSRMSFEECAKNIHKVIRASLREYARTVEIFREMEDKEVEETTHAKAGSYRSVVPMLMRVGSIVFEGLNLGVSICPQMAKRSFDCLSDTCPYFFPKTFLNNFNNKKTGLFDLSKFGKQISKGLSFGSSISTTGREITENYQHASQTELDGQCQRAKELSERRSREANERRSESDDLLQQLQQMNREIAEAIRSIARN